MTTPGEQRRPAADAAAGIGRAPAALARLVGRGLRRLSMWNRRGGAEESGLARLVEVHALQAAGDATVAVALAGSLFFSVPTGQARTQVGLYLLVTMAPFAVLAPVIGPVLDRFHRGRRVALAVTMVARGTLALVIAHSLATHLSLADKLTLYPAALGVLVAIKTYSVVRSAAVPRLLPPTMTLVQANSRLTMVTVIVPGLAAAIAIGVVKLGGHAWALRLGAAAYAAGAFRAMLLPQHADGGADVRATETRLGIGNPLRLGQNDAVIGGVLRSAAALRWLNGFLLFFGAFVVREHRLGSLSPTLALGALAIGIGAGNLAGVVIGGRLRNLSAGRFAVALLAATTATTALTAVSFGILTVFVEAVVAAAAAAMLKLVLDATIQRRVDDTSRTSTFARSETTLQLAWVVGGGVGIVLPTHPAALGFALAAAAVGAALVAAIRFAARRPQNPLPAKPKAPAVPSDVH